MLHIPYIETHIADQCNLKCKGCSHFSSIAKPRLKKIVEFAAEFKRLAEIAEIGTIRLMGGEPLLNPNFMGYCRIARRYFPNSHICLVSNGLLLHRIEKHAAELNELDIDVTVSNYHYEKQELGYAALIKHNQTHEKSRMYNISLDLAGEQDKTRSYATCDLVQNKWLFFQDGRLYLCCIAGNIDTFAEHFDIDLGFTQKDLSVDIFDNTPEQIQSFLESPCELCRFCDIAKREKSYTPFALGKGEITEWLI